LPIKWTSEKLPARKDSPQKAESIKKPLSVYPVAHTEVGRGLKNRGGGIGVMEQERRGQRRESLDLTYDKGH